MDKFFILENQIIEDKVFLNGENAFHILSVLRHKVGDKIEVSSGDGFDYICEIFKIQNNEVFCKIIDCFGNSTEPKVQITLYQSLPKGEKMELIIQKSVEIGVNKIIPVYTERTITKLSGKEEKKLLRWNKISESAAKQSRRGIIPKIDNILSFNEAIKDSKKNSLNIIPYEKEQNNSIKNVIKKVKNLSELKKIGVFIGPEGGFTQKEIDLAIKENILPITLGNRILRTETAGIVTTTILIYELEN